MMERDRLIAAVERLAELAERRSRLVDGGATVRGATVGGAAAGSAAGATADGAPAERARRLREHVATYLVPRARALERPLVATIAGPTGAGKSSLLNGLAGAAVSVTGVLRPTTRKAVVLANGHDLAAMHASDAFAGLPGPIVEVVHEALPGIAMIDAPDVDSLERANRALADALLEMSDLAVVVTTPVRYADLVPWQVLGRALERRLPLVVVLNRAPPDAAQTSEVLDDLRRLVGEAGLEPLVGLGGLDVVVVPEGRLGLGGQGLDPAAVAPIRRRLDDLAADREARDALVASALAGALAGARSLVHAVADDLEHEAIDADAARRVAELAYADEARVLRDELRAGTFLRDEVMAQWQAFVGADQVTRLFSSGVGRLRGALLAALRGVPPAPIRSVEQGTSGDLVELVTGHAAAAARRIASRWHDEPRTARLLAADAALWTASNELPDRVRAGVSAWIESIDEDVRRSGASKRLLARGASLGVNAAGVAVMLGVFAHTGGVTGAEAGVAAVTAVLNQKLLNALFGEAAVVEMIGRARARLDGVVAEAFGADRARYERLVPAGDQLRSLAGELRATTEALG